MEKVIKRHSEYITYVYPITEFKQLLGIGDDPHGILTVDVNFYTRKVTVTMSSNRQ
jgi:hypothetical protein